MATFGKLTQGASTGTSILITTDVQMIHCKFTAPEYGLLTSISFWANATSGTVDMSGSLWGWGGTSGTPYLHLIAEDNGSATGVNTTPQLVTVNFNNVLISAGTVYGLSMWASGEYNYYTDAGATDQAYGGVIAPFRTYPSDDSSTNVDSVEVSIYATYTPRAVDNSTYRTIAGLLTVEGLQSIEY